MGAFFKENRFIRISEVPSITERLPLLEDEAILRNLLLSMYALKHMRGSAVLEPTHDNNTFTEEQLALALVKGKVELKGSFLRVA